MATKSKALFDLLYFKKQMNKIQAEQLLQNSLRINWSLFNKNDVSKFIKYTKLSKSKKMQTYQKIIAKLI